MQKNTQLSVNTKTIQTNKLLQMYIEQNSRFPLCSIEKTKKTSIIWFTASLQSSKGLQSKTQVHVFKAVSIPDTHAFKTITHYSTDGYSSYEIPLYLH